MWLFSGEAAIEFSPGSCRIYREAVRELSPDLQAWGDTTQQYALKGRPKGDSQYPEPRVALQRKRLKEKPPTVLDGKTTS
jgi:hypothetical protein